MPILARYSYCGLPHSFYAQFLKDAYFCYFTY